MIVMIANTNSIGQGHDSKLQLKSIKHFDWQKPLQKAIYHTVKRISLPKAHSNTDFGVGSVAPGAPAPCISTECNVSYISPPFYVAKSKPFRHGSPFARPKIPSNSAKKIPYQGIFFHGVMGILSGSTPLEM